MMTLYTLRSIGSSLIIFLLIQILFIAWIPCASSDDHHQRKKSHHDEKQSTHGFHPKDKGHEATGIIAAGLFAAANITVILSLLFRGVRRSPRIAQNTKAQLKRFNQFQKKCLLPFHFILNPIALFFALTHFLLSFCRSSTLPEWGLGGMAMLATIGILIKLKILPESIRRKLYLFHTHPLPLCLFVVILFIGHGMVD